jgi:hypothetical protein
MASGKGNTNAINYLKLVFQAVNWANVADNAATSPLTNLYVSLHTADPGAGGSQTTSEAAYTGYARVAVVRTSSGWSISAETISNVGAITFPASTSGPEVETYVGVGSAISGAGVLFWRGALTASLTVNNGITPSIAIGALTITEA